MSVLGILSFSLYARLCLKGIHGQWLQWLWCTPATNSIKAAFPNSVIRTFIDDRTVVSPSASEAVQICQEWSRWSRLLGLEENQVKTALWHSTAAGQRHLQNQGVEPTQHPKILGVQLQGAKQRSNTQQESDRIRSCAQLLQRSRYLPISWAAKRRVIVGAVFGKLTWGWVFHLPPKATINTIQSTVNRALGELQGGCPHFRSILRGHSLNVHFRLLQTNISAAWRLARQGVRPCQWSNKGWPKVIDKLLETYDWTHSGAWEWEQEELGAFQLHNVPGGEGRRRKRFHILRESFRRKHFAQFLNSSRREAAYCNEQDIHYNEDHCRIARNLCKDRKTFHVMCGATVSVAAYAKMTHAEVPEQCPWCGCAVVPTAAHVAWECAGVDSARQRILGTQFAGISNHVQKRLGWPTGHQLDAAVLRWLVEVRDLFLQDRYR